MPEKKQVTFVREDVARVVRATRPGEALLNDAKRYLASYQSTEEIPAGSGLDAEAFDLLADYVMTLQTLDCEAQRLLAHLDTLRTRSDAERVERAFQRARASGYIDDAGLAELIEAELYRREAASNRREQA